MSAIISRRALAKGAAWAAPAVVATTTIPVYASSKERTDNPPLGSICSLFFGGGTTNSQTTSVYLSVQSDNGMIAAGQTVSWVFNMSAGTVPGLEYPKDGAWTLTTSPAKGTTTNQFTVTLVANQDISVDRVNCIARVIWDGSGSGGLSSRITPGSTLSVLSSGGDATYSSTITIPRRWGSSVNDTKRTPLRIDGDCYPTIQWSYINTATRYDKDTILYFNGNGPILPDSNANNNQKVTTGTCTQ